MKESEQFQIITFYEFKDLGAPENLGKTRQKLKSAMKELSIYGTIIIAAEGFNSTISGLRENIAELIKILEAEFETKLNFKTSYYSANPFKRAKVRIKKEIVTLKQKIEIEKGKGTHVGAARWNELINDPETLILDTRNEYEIEFGTFANAVNPHIEEFNQLPEFIGKNLNPRRRKKIAIFCTGGIRCEKFAPLMKDLGFAEVYQLEGGILKYLEEIPEKDNLWRGECFVFDERIAVKKDDFIKTANGKKSDE